jgi:prolipoprotein diacylglyceryltransferase
MILTMPPLAVTPWFLPPSLNLGPLTIQAFGVITVIGILVGVQLAAGAATTPQPRSV